jgi:hypothetical protein
MSHHGEQTAITDTEAYAVWCQHLWEKSKLRKVSSVCLEIPDDKLTEMLPSSKPYSQTDHYVGTPGWIPLASMLSCCLLGPCSTQSSLYSHLPPMPTTRKDLSQPSQKPGLTCRKSSLSLQWGSHLPQVFLSVYQGRDVFMDHTPLR